MAASKLRIARLDDGDDTNWDQLVASSPQGNSFLRADWLRMLVRTDASIGVERYVVWDQRGRLRGGWALPLRQHFGLCFATDYDLFYAGPMLAPDLTPPAFSCRGEHDAVLSLLARAFGAHCAVIAAEAHPALSDVRAFLDAGWSVAPVYTHVWDLQEADLILLRMNREKRREIKLGAQRYRCEQETLSGSSLEQFLHLYRLTVHKFGLAPGTAWERGLRERLSWMEASDGCRLYAARDGDGRLAAAVLVLLSRDDQTAYLWRMGQDPGTTDRTAVPTLYWSVVLQLREDAQLANAIRWVNLGGSPQQSLARFKDYLGATPTLHFRLIRRQRSGRLRLWETQLQARALARRWRGWYRKLRAGWGRSSSS